MKLSALFKNREPTSGKQLPWQYWRPSCKHPQTLSFRAGDDVFKTVNSVFFDQYHTTAAINGVETPESWFTNSSILSESESFSTESDHHRGIFVDGESLEMVVRCAMSSTTSEEERRIFFEPCRGDTSSILEETAAVAVKSPMYKESVVVAMESEDPYVDFRRSMEEMVETHGIKDWECLEELLGWYLKVNGKNNHGFIIGAFIDLLLAISTNSNSTDSSDIDHYSSSYSSAVSSFASSPNLCSTHEIEEEEEEEEDQNTNIVLN